MASTDASLPSPLKRHWEDTRRPIYSAILVLPFLLTYEIGMLILQPGVINGGDALIRRMLNLLSVHTAFASALVLVGCFLVWQWRTEASLKVDQRRVGWLFLECAVFAQILFWILSWFSRHVHAPAPAAAAAGGGLGNAVQNLVLYCGAGVYEELVFRVLLLGLLMLVFTKLMHAEKSHAAAISVVIGALLFALFHYGPGGDVFTLDSFLQRTFAGVYFSALYVTRSFGVAAASHAMYDIRVGIHHL